MWCSPSNGRPRTEGAGWSNVLILPGAVNQQLNARMNPLVAGIGELPRQRDGAAYVTDANHLTRPGGPLSTVRSMLLTPVRIAVAGLLAAGAVAVVQPSPAMAAAIEWAQPGYAAGRTFYNPDESVINAGSINDLGHRWAVGLPPSPQLSCTGPSAPLVSGGRVFVTTELGIAAYHAYTGGLLWHFVWALPDDERTPQLAVSGGVLLAANTDCNSTSDPNGRLLALNAATGSVRWSANTDAPARSLVVDKGIAVVAGGSASDSDTVNAFRVSDGKFRWGRTGYWSPGVSAGGKLLLSRTDAAGTSAVAITTGKTLWTKKKMWFGAAATPAGDHFYVTDVKGALICIKSSNGAVVWTAKGASGLIAADGKRVYRSVTDGVEALNAKNGKRLWDTAFGGDTGQPVRAGGLVYTAVDGGEPLGILNAATGSFASPGWHLGSLDTGNVVVTGGQLYLVNGNTLYAYAP